MNLTERMESWYDRNVRAHSKHYSAVRKRSPRPFKDFSDDELMDAHAEVEDRLQNLSGPMGSDPLLDERMLIEEEMRRRGLNDDD